MLKAELELRREFIAAMLGWRKAEQANPAYHSWYVRTEFAEYIIANNDMYHDKYWNPDNNWNQLMETIDFVEALPNQQLESADPHSFSPEVYIEEVFLTKRGLTIRVNIWKDDGLSWRYQEFGTTVQNMSKKEATFYTLSEFAAWYNSNIDLFNR